MTPIQKTILYDQNAIYYGYPIKKLMEKAGAGIADVLIRKYGTGKRIGFFCGPGNNGGDGFAAARYLVKKDKTSKPFCFLIPSAKKINTSESKLNWKLLDKIYKKDNIMPVHIPDNFDVVVDCLFGTGINGKLRDPYPTIIKKLNSLKAKKVTIDLPSPGFKSDFNISMMFAKIQGAAVVDIGFPKNIKEKIGIGEIKVLNKPNENSHKGDNGKLLIIGGSEQYHGAPILAASIASRFVDLVYFASTIENNKLIAKMKSKLAEFIAIKQDKIEEYIKKVDVILIGPGLGISNVNQKLVNKLLKKYKNKKFVIDADALSVLDKNLLNQNCIITPHKVEFKKLFGISATKENAFKMAKKYKCVIVLKGKTDYVADKSEVKINTTGNPGMTKGGTGDVLAGLIASLACQNELFLAASAGVFLNGLAAESLAKRVLYCYNAGDLAKEIPRVFVQNI